MKSRQIELLKLGFIKNDDQECYTLGESGQTWYIDFKIVLDYTENKWVKFMKNVKNDREIEADYLKRSDKFKLGYDSAKKQLKQKINDSLNMYKSRLRDEKYIKLTKTINKDKVRELEIRIETLNNLLWKNN